MKTVLLTLLGVALLVTAGAAVMIASGAYNFAADSPHWRLTETLIGAARHRSIDQRARIVWCECVRSRADAYSAS